jgi:hypothetical protein
VEAKRELILEDASSIREGLWRMARHTQDVAESLDSRIEDEDLDGLAEAVEVREALERLQALSLERVMSSIRNGLGMRETEIAKEEPSRPWNPHSYAVFAQVHNTL